MHSTSITGMLVLQGVPRLAIGIGQSLAGGRRLDVGAGGAVEIAGDAL